MTTPLNRAIARQRANIAIGTLALFALQAAAQGLPPELEAALTRAKLPTDALVAVVVDAEGRQPPRLIHRATEPVNPASVMKLLTTFAALEQLGPAFVWTTPVYVGGPVREGTLHGNLYIKGQGDPKLVVERLWLLMRRVQGMGIRQIAGDIVLDRSAFEHQPPPPGAFDGEPLRPYNAAPDALLLNFKSMVLSFVPDPGGKIAHVQMEPPLAGVHLQATVPLMGGDCGDYRGALRGDFSDPTRVRFTGSYPASCGEKAWPVAYADPASFSQRAIAGMWSEIGGRMTGRVRDGNVPAGARASFEVASPVLADVVRDINKFSNNVMAQQLFLTLSLRQKGVGTMDGSREVLRNWWVQRFGNDDVPVFDGGSGLSRQTRISAQALVRLLQVAWASPLMPELVNSLAIVGVDGTLRRARARVGGSAHLKTGSLRDVTAVAGFVHATSGRRYVLVAIVNNGNSAAARPVFDALIDWAVQD